jgi:hypothetical protein
MDGAAVASIKNNLPRPENAAPAPALMRCRGSSSEPLLRSGLADTDRYRRYAAELVALAPDVLLATGTSTLGPLQQVTRTLPIVFVNAFDPVGGGYVESLARCQRANLVRERRVLRAAHGSELQHIPHGQARRHGLAPLARPMRRGEQAVAKALETVISALPCPVFAAFGVSIADPV